MLAAHTLNQLIPAKRHDMRVVGIDPGETTGICCLQGGKFIAAEQLPTKELLPGIDEVAGWLKEYDPDVVVMEDYRVYSWESDKHKWAALHTPKLIGAVHTICYYQRRPLTLRMAQAAKGFVTDKKLEEWGLYKKAKRHSRDALRHAIYHLIFSKDEENELPVDFNGSI